MINDPHLLFCKKAVVLFNLGGPSSLDEVNSFLFNLFNDEAIITLPNPFRYLLAKFLAKRRTPFAKEIYKEMGGKSPILENTLLQADHLQNMFSKNSEVKNGKDIQYKVFVAMRYAEPRIKTLLPVIKDWNPDEIILLPLYPQYSTTTTQSFFNEWMYECKKHKFDIKTNKINSYETNKSFIVAVVETIKPHLKSGCRILFSAHGLPQKIVNKGDPYQKHVIASVEAVMSQLPPNDYVICYQSKVGPLKWLEPSTVAEIERAGKDGVGVVVVPIAFVSEHSETLVELDIEYKELAHEHKVPFYIRVPVVGVDSNFIKCLYDLAKNYK